MHSFRSFVTPALAIVLTTAVSVESKISSERPRSSGYRAEGAVAQPYTYNRVHRIGNIAFNVTNYGFFGSELRRQTDPCTRRPAPSFEFPIGTGVEYLYQGAMWVGAVKGRDTLVSVGADGWQDTNEMFPRPYPEGDMIERTIRPILRSAPNSPCPDVMGSEDAVSEQDFISVFYDTVTNAQFVNNDPFDGPHAPLGIEVTQRSYSWSFDYAKDFILMDFGIRNIFDRVLTGTYIGLYMDHDVHHQSTSEGAQDDITGFTPTVPSPVGEGFLDTINIAWIADNDGDPRGGRFDFSSPTGVSGVRVVRAPKPGLQFSFNWWIGSTNSGRDWGPNKRNSKVVYLVGNRGTPEGDKAKYQVLSNGEFDYNQIESAIDHQVDGWLPAVTDPTLAADLADGFDTRYLLSFGPFDLAPDSVIPLTIAIVAGADFHTDPRNFTAFFDPGNPEAFLERLDLTNFARNAQWAGWVYDTPGFDTDSNGTRGSFRIVSGDTIYYTGDGVPDFQGPPPPPAPLLRFETFEGKIVMRWNGEKSETTKDVFSNIADFEGYRVYMSRTGQLADFALLAQRDNINFIRYQYKPEALRWIVKDPPFELDSLKTLYDSLSLSTRGFPFYPDSFKVPSVDYALREILLDDIDPSKLDTNHYYFAPFDANKMVDDKAAAYFADSLGRDVVGVIRKRFPYATPPDTIIEYGEPYAMYYEYEYAIDGLQLAEPVHLAVTTFDFGNPAAGLTSLESSPLANEKEVWPLNSAAVVKETRPKPGVYPNPYRLADDYNALGWEDPGRQGIDPERARKVTFTNVPDTCTIKIWTLDGDLVRKIDHAEPPLDSRASVVVWDLITRNTQAAKTGLYIYTIESRFGTDVGKLAIIK